MNLRRHVWSARRKSQRCGGTSFPCDQPAVLGNDLELIPTVTMESRHSVDGPGPSSHEFSSIYIAKELWGPEVGSRWRFFQKSCLFGKNDHLWANSLRRWSKNAHNKSKMAEGQCPAMSAVDILKATQQGPEPVRRQCWWGGYWRNLANTIEPSVCGGDVALCQITVTTC